MRAALDVRAPFVVIVVAGVFGAVLLGHERPTSSDAPMS